MMGPKEKKERSLGEKLHLKAERCLGAKCVMIRRPSRPGPHGASRRRAPSDFARQLKEKQKFKVSYGLDERNLRALYEKAASRHGDVAATLMQYLEGRLDNVLYRAGMAGSRSMARTMIVHGHIFVNGKKVRSPGYEVKEGDIVSIRKESAPKMLFKELSEAIKRTEAPSWLKGDPEKMECRVVSTPMAPEHTFEINLLVESFSK